jgi:DNA-binding Lrp family transcriptional regulator
MRPKDKERYIETVVLELLQVNPRGITIREVSDKTGFNRDTVAKHLERLVATREAYKTVRSNLSVYYRNGQVVHATDVKDASAPSRRYTFFKLENEEGKFYYIQEKEVDEFRAIRVKGGIFVNADYAMQFIKEFQRFVVGARDNE